MATAGSLARFFHQLSPDAERSFLSRPSRREMTRRHWRDEDLSVERHYGLGTISGPPGEWEWFGHSGAFQGFISRTAVLPRKGLAISVMTNAIDGPAHMWVEGIIHILKTFADNGAPKPEIADWLGRWWTIWGAVDQVPVGDRIRGAAPAYFLPFTDASQMEVTGPNMGRIARAAGLNNHGEAVRRVRDGHGNVREVWVGGTRLVSEEELRDEMRQRYQG